MKKADYQRKYRAEKKAGTFTPRPRPIGGKSTGENKKAYMVNYYKKRKEQGLRRMPMDPNKRNVKRRALSLASLRKWQLKTYLNTVNADEDFKAEFREYFQEDQPCQMAAT